MQSVGRAWPLRAARGLLVRASDLRGRLRWHGGYAMPEMRAMSSAHFCSRGRRSNRSLSGAVRPAQGCNGQHRTGVAARATHRHAEVASADETRILRVAPSVVAHLRKHREVGAAVRGAPCAGIRRGVPAARPARIPASWQAAPVPRACRPRSAASRPRPRGGSRSAHRPALAPLAAGTAQGAGRLRVRPEGLHCAPADRAYRSARGDCRAGAVSRTGHLHHRTDPRDRRRLDGVDGAPAGDHRRQPASGTSCLGLVLPRASMEKGHPLRGS